MSYDQNLADAQRIAEQYGKVAETATALAKRLEARLAEATALLDQSLSFVLSRNLRDDVEAFLSRAPAQPAALTGPELAERYGFEPHGRLPEVFGLPAPPEPSAIHGGFTCAEAEKGALRLAAGFTEQRDRAESAEAQLAAVIGEETPEHAAIIIRAWQTLSQDAREAAWDEALLSPPSPSAVPGEES